MTHEAFLNEIRRTAVSRLNEESDRNRALQAKLVYGSGNPGVRGTCFFRSWENHATQEFIEICASGEESATQLVGTTLHELAHCLAGCVAGHGSVWRMAAKKLGLIHAEAAGQRYSISDFDPALWLSIESLAKPADGRPRFNTGVGRVVGARACPLGRGTRGGKSRGPGSGSRLRLFICDCRPPIRIRVARDSGKFRVRCLDCETVFRLAEPSDGKDERVRLAG
jgi:hypothetical protein